VSPAAHHFEYRVASQARERLRSALVVAFSVCGLGLLAYGGWQLAKDAGAPKRRTVQQISVIRPPLPPKPPPEPERKREEVKQEIKQPEPEEKPADGAPPPMENLGLDAQGSSGGDSFGLVGRPGGRDITTIGNDEGKGSGTGRINAALYASQLQTQIQDALNRNDRLRDAEYRAQVSLWLASDGSVSRVELAGSTGDDALDRRLRAALAEAKKLRPPPEGLEQPIRLELVARRT
jgi:protein TonB